MTNSLIKNSRPTKRVSSIWTHKFDLADIKEYESMKRKPILFVRHLSKKYFNKKKPAINNISFDVYPGEFHAFIGANGAGKTTTIKSLIGAYINWNGTILVNGVKNNREEAKKKLGYIPENARFPEKFSAFKYLQWMTMLSGLSRAKAKEFAINKLKSLQMWSLRNKSPNSFSSGQKKKILLAQALTHDPDIIIMDEPVANLDPKARKDFFNVLASLRKQGKAIFISSHVLAELDRYADSCTILDGGEIIFDGSKHKLLQMFPSNKYQVNTEKNNIAITYFKSRNIKYSQSDDGEYFVVTFANKKEVSLFQNKMLHSKNTILMFKNVEPSLDQVYEKLIVKGSVDTQKG